MKKDISIRLTEFNEIADNLYTYLEKEVRSLQSEYDERSRTWQESDKGEEMYSNIDSLQEVLNGLVDITDALDNVVY